MQCIHCQSENVVKNGTKTLKTAQVVQYFLCKDCGRRFNERSGTPMARLRTPVETISMAINARTEGLGIRAAGRVLGKSPTSILLWEKRLSAQLSNFSPPSPKEAEVTIKGDEVYTRVGKNLPPWLSEGWTIHFIDRESRYWFEARAGLKDESLFEKSVKAAWDWAKPSSSIRWFTDGERRYSKVLWKLASAYLPRSTTTQAYPFRKIWRAGLEVAMKLKGSQGKPRVVWVNREHPYTAISPKSDVHANHLEALHSSLRRRASSYRRRQNHYAKTVEGLQRALNVQRLIHNWCRSHYSHGYQRTPAMVMGFIQRPVKIGEVLTVRAFECLTS
ncbi:IS1 family transposase [Acaryochloris marina]|uniref:IS1 family transposase n=1 Tax=Acaryochloris marina TaxID=155978 RepID=UPI0011D053F7|nr:IS1 family transposase [Acaryochloris marina]